MRLLIFELVEDGTEIRINPEYVMTVKEDMTATSNRCESDIQLCTGLVYRVIGSLNSITAHLMGISP